jgi:hypothetical protein
VPVLLVRPDEDELGVIEPPERALEEALIVGLHLGADGQRIVEICEGPLPDAERAHVTKHFVFPLHVTRGVLWATDRMAPRDAYDWESEPSVRIAKGRYRAELHFLDDETIEAKNANWTLTLVRVKSFDGLRTWPELPHEDGTAVEAPALPVRDLGRVRHPKFGEGVVVSSDGERLVVRFADGERRLLSKFVTPIER